MNKIRFFIVFYCYCMCLFCFPASVVTNYYCEIQGQPRMHNEMPQSNQIVGGDFSKDQNNLIQLASIAEQGNVAAQLDLAFRYSEGIGVQQDLGKALKWFVEAAELGDESAQVMLSIYYAEGNEYVARDPQKAMMWALKAANQGDAFSQYYLGCYYRDGEGAPQNYEEAIKWFLLAAEQGNKDAQYELGECYYYGVIAPMDREKATGWYKKAAEQGLPLAQNMLAQCYEYGHGGSVDYMLAVKWYRSAAIQGVSDAAENLAVCYSRYSSVSNDVEAYAWAIVSARTGSSYWEQKILPKLTSDQVKKGELKAEEILGELKKIKKGSVLNGTKLS
jgi:uncharacterized protein